MTGSRAADTAVPLTERMRVLQLVRVAAAALTLLLVHSPAGVASTRPEVVGATLALLGLAGLGEVVARLLQAYVAAVLGALLIVDGIWLTWVVHLTGGLASPLRYAVLLHLAAVVLAASYRTGAKIALWDVLLLYAVEDAVRRGALAAPPGTAATGESWEVFVVVLWLVAGGTAVLSAVNERELRRGRQDLEAQTRLAERLEAARDPAGVAHALLDAVTVAGHFRRGLVLGGPEGQLLLLAGHGLAQAPRRRPGGSLVVERAQQAGRAVLTSGVDPEQDAWLTALLPMARDVVVVPLRAEGRPLGALVLEHTPRARRRPGLPRRVVEALERSSAYTALALRNAWLLEQLQRLAATDGLTKIANRRTFESTLDRELARAVRSGEPVSLVLLDIDHFKRLNDTHGHQAGDEVLRNVAAALSCECRDFDTPARYGGEEFVVVLPGCGPEEALRTADRLRRACARAPSVVPVTASAGVASFPVHASSADSLVRAADEALYASKRAGRDQSSLSPGGPDPDELRRLAVVERLAR